MDGNRKPRICEVLGVEVGEEWQVSNGGYTYRIGSSGRREIKAQNGCWVSADTEALLTDIINHPERIIRKSRWTEDDIADAKAVRRLWPHAITVKRFKALVEVCEVIYTSHGDGTYHKYVNYYDVSEDAFPSLKMGERVHLSEILGAERYV